MEVKCYSTWSWPQSAITSLQAQTEFTQYKDTWLYITFNSHISHFTEKQEMVDYWMSNYNTMKVSSKSVLHIVHVVAGPRIYREISNIRCTKSQNLHDSCVVLQLSLPNPLKSGTRSRRRCSWSIADRPCSNYIWVINNFILPSKVWLILEIWW